MNFNLVSITLVLISISSILPSSFSQDANALQKQYGGLISQGLGAIQDAAKKDGGEGSSNIQNLIQSAKTVQAKCVQQLMPCKDYFKDSKADNIPQSCCQPMRAVISDDMDCLCGVVKGEGLLKNINLTLDNVFKVAKACGAEPDMDACDGTDAQAPAPSTTKFNTLTKPTTPSPESSPKAASPDSSKESSDDSSEESADDSSIETPSPESSPSPDSSVESSPSPDSSDEIPSPESSPAPDSSANTPPPEPSLADTPATAPASLDAPADESGAHMEKSSLIVLVSAFILLAI